MKRLWLGLLVAVVTLLGLGVFAYQGRGADDQVGFDYEHSDLRPEQAGRFSDFALYSLGESFEGLELAAITRRDDAADPYDAVSANYVGFLYGDCEALDDDGCAPPLEVQVWPACVRNLSSYQLTPVAGSELPHEDVQVRGVPGAVFEEGTRLEVYSGEETIVLFGDDEAQLLRAAAALSSVAADGVEPGEPLPAPAPDALAGGLSC